MPVKNNQTSNSGHGSCCGGGASGGNGGWLGLILIPTLLLGGILGYSWVGKYYSADKVKQVSGTPKLEISPKEYDAGTVSMAAGLVKKTFEVKNVGSGELKIEGIRTSCHCTTVILELNGKKSPTFAMDSNLPFWSEKIKPGEVAQLEVIFDPAFHGPMGVGQAIRSITFSTNDPDNKKAEITFMANVIQ